MRSRSDGGVRPTFPDLEFTYPTRNRLAIVVPAYKAAYFRQSLTSIANQTRKDFILYVGDDASPEDLGSIVGEFADRLEIVYRRFDDNLGGKDLVSQWERCVDLVEDEDLIWVFSDDDTMGPGCVENFHKTLDAGVESDVFHVHLDIVDSDGRVVKRCGIYPERFSGPDFFRDLFLGRIDARMPDFILNKSHFLRQGRFERFDLAFRSDTATILKLAFDRGIATVPHATMLWRTSRESISSSVDQELSLRKVRASIDFFNWVEVFFRERGTSCPLSPLTRLHIVLENVSFLVGLFGLGAAVKELRRLEFVRKNRAVVPFCAAFLRFQSRFYPNHRGL